MQDSDTQIGSNSITYKSYKTRKPGGNYVFKHENINSYTDSYGVVYKIRDHVYIDIKKPNQPFAIACILDFKLTKRDFVVIEVRWYFRPNEIPDGVYLPLMQDRISENNSIANQLEPIIKSRELFASESRDIYPASFIKGKCRVFHYQDILEAKNFKPFADTFFCILTYNPEARRLANTQGEIRVGASHQAKLPVFKSNIKPENMPEKCEDWETLTWKCKRLSDSLLFGYLQAARSIEAFANICERNNLDDLHEAFQSDSITVDALDVLNENNYNVEKALLKLTKLSVFKNNCKKWTEEEQKKFIKGLVQYGKDFFQIRKEFLIEKDTFQLVEYYYLWKKTTAAQNQRLRRRLRPSYVKKSLQITSSNTNINQSNKKIQITNSNNANQNEQLSGGSELESDNNESDESSDQKQSSSNVQQNCCANCLTSSSKDLQNGGKNNQLLCYDCRMYYKKYGDLPSIQNKNNLRKYEHETLSENSDENSEKAEINKV